MLKLQKAFYQELKTLELWITDYGFEVVLAWIRRSYSKAVIKDYRENSLVLLEGMKDHISTPYEVLQAEKNIKLVLAGRYRSGPKNVDTMTGRLLTKMVERTCTAIFLLLLFQLEKTTDGFKLEEENNDIIFNELEIDLQVPDSTDVGFLYPRHRHAEDFVKKRRAIKAKFNNLKSKQNGNFTWSNFFFSRDEFNLTRMPPNGRGENGIEEDEEANTIHVGDIMEMFPDAPSTKQQLFPDSFQAPLNLVQNSGIYRYAFVADLKEYYTKYTNNSIVELAKYWGIKLHQSISIAANAAPIGYVCKLNGDNARGKAVEEILSVPEYLNTVCRTFLCFLGCCEVLRFPAKEVGEEGGEECDTFL